ARDARRRRRGSVKPPARSSAKRPRRQSEKLPGSRRGRLPHRQNAKLRRRSRPSARRLNEQNARPPKIRDVGEPAKSEVAAKPESSFFCCRSQIFAISFVLKLGERRPPFDSRAGLLRPLTALGQGARVRRHQR